MKYALPIVSTAAVLVLLALLLSPLARRRLPFPTRNSSLGQKVDPMKLKQATFAAGCFWGVEAAFRRVPGVVATEVGFTGGHTENPTYDQVCTHTTGHAEAVLVSYDPQKVSYPELLDAFWSCHDPTTADRQGPDVGSQYRSAIFFHDPEQERLARASLKEVDQSGVFGSKIVTQIVPAPRFYPAEDYHQQYFERRGTADSCHTGIATVHTKLAAEAAQQRTDATRPVATTG